MRNKITAILATVFLVAACYQDESTFATFEYPDIVITPIMASDTLSYPYGETVRLGVNAVQDGVSSSELEYLWEIDVNPGSTRDRAFISDERVFDYRILNTPSSSPYYLTLQVTNKTSGYAKVMSWPLYVTSSLGEGILVGHTRNGGVTSELDLVAAQSITYGYVDPNPRYVRNLFSISNEEVLEGTVRTVFSRASTDMDAATISSFNENSIMIGTDRHLFSLDPLTYKVSRSDGQLFNAGAVGEYNVYLNGAVGGYSSYLGVDEQFFSCMDLLDHSYAPCVYPGGQKRGTFAVENVCASKDDQGCVYVYDQDLCTVAYCPGWNISSSSFNFMSDDKLPDRSSLQGKRSIAAGIIRGQKGAFILSDGASHYLLVVDYVAGSTGVLYDLAAPEIENAVAFGFCDNTDIFYYVTPTTIYTNVISGGAVATKALSWKASDPAEKITMIQQYSQAWFGINQFDTRGDSLHPYAFPIESHRLQMIIVTYNESTGEGKFYLRPFNVSTGMFSAFKNNGEYGGFGEITAIGTTMR